MNRAFPGIALILAASLAPGCGGATDDFGPPMSIVVHTPAEAGLEALGVSEVRVTVTGADLTAPVIQTFPRSLGAGSLGAIPYGFERSVLVEGLGGDSQVIARGRSLPTDVPVGEPAEVHVYVTPIERFTPAQSFAAGGSPAVLAEGRVGHTVTPLADGRVLIAGGAAVKVDGAGELVIERIYDSMEVYDPATGILEQLSVKLYPGRAFHTATRLRGAQGYVLLSGGMTFIEGHLVSLQVSDIFSPSTPGGGTLFQTMDLHTPRARHAATLRHDGSVLITGGVWINEGDPQHFDDSDGIVSVLDTVELFKVREPQYEVRGCNHIEWTYCAQPSMTSPRVDHGAVRVGDAVMVVGGQNMGEALSTTDMYRWDESIGSSAGVIAEGPRLTQPRLHAAVVRRSDDVVVVIGGQGPPPAGDGGQDDGNPLGSIEVYDPLSPGGEFKQTLAALSVGRSRPAAAVLEDDRILVAGGEGPGGGFLDDAWILDAANGGVSAARSLAGTTLSDARADAVAVTMGTGAILIAGGSNRPSPTSYQFPVAVDLFTP